jgi:DNA-directed RNA polymerase subunit RPC12/RpoP
MSKTHWKNLANYNYLGAYSLDGSDVESIILTIADVKVEEVTGPNGKKDNCVVVYFEEKNVSGVEIKPMVFNKTNCKVLQKMYSPYIEDWVGKRIEVYSTEVKYQRDLVPALRVKDKIIAPIDYKCSICGKEVAKEQYNAIIAKYGVVVCSKECVDKLKEKQNNKEEGENE